jgi:rubrerythrin
MSNSAAASESQTLRDLQAAYQGESNASIKYSAYAIAAEVDGFVRAAALFRAAARAEQVHAAHHARVIVKLGGTPHAGIHAPEVKSTREDIEAAKAGEEYERDVMYPAYIKEAEAGGHKDAVRSFTLASKAEAVHARLYGEALANLEAQRVQTTFYVCLVCGEVTDNPADMEHCPICGAPREKFEAVR